MAKRDYLHCHGCGRHTVRVRKSGRHRCSYCWATWLSADNYAKGLEGREPLEIGKAKHTPGPWHIEINQYDMESVVICKVGEGTLALINPECGPDKVDRANANLMAASPTMHKKLTDTVAWLDREIKNRRELRGNMDDEVNQFMNLDTGFQLERLTELRDDLAETLRKIGEGI